MSIISASRSASYAALFSLLATASYAQTNRPVWQFAANENEEEVGRALERERGRPGCNFSFVIDDLDLLNPSQVRFSLGQIAPTEIAAVSSMTFATNASVLAVLDARFSSMRYLRRERTGETMPVLVDKNTISGGKNVLDAKVSPSYETYFPRWTVWAQGTGLWGWGKRYEGFAPYDWFNNTDLVGADYWISENVFIGGFGGYSGSWMDFRNGSTIDSNGARFGLYTGWQSGGAYVTGVAYGGYTWYDWDRKISFPFVNRTAEGRPESYDAGFNLSGGYDFNMGGFIIGPFGGVGYTHFSMSSFQERGADAIGVRFDDWSTNSLRSTVGLHVAYPISFGETYPILMPDLRVSWQHEFLDGSERIDARFVGGRQPRFKIKTPDSDEDSVLIAAGVNAQITEAVGTYVYYSGDLLREDRFTHAVTAGIAFSF